MAKSRYQSTERPRVRSLLRRTDQAVIALCVAAALASLAAYWLLHGGHRGELIEIDRATPRDPQFNIDLNKAEWPEFTVLPSIGEVLAKRIVASRKNDGPFRDHADLMRVRGIGPRTLERVAPYLLPMAESETVADAAGPSDAG